jgi:DNA-binding response OmpR family regulator
MRQVIVNLLSNAVKFTPRGGRVSLHTKALPGERVRIAVTDTGMGIAETDRSKLFREFSQVDGSVTRRFGGTGLGLAICKRLVELHGGQIDFESTIGVGSTFWFELPASNRAVATFGPASTKIRRASSSRRLEPIPAHGTVLVLDEDPASQRLVESALLGAGITAVSATTLADARRLARAPQLELIVVDPVIAGERATVVNRFVSDRFGASVVVSSLATQTEAMVGLLAGVFVEKPINREDLVAQVRAMRERRHAPRTALVVDSNDEDSRAVATILEREGFSVQIAASLSAARAGLEREVSLLIVELNLSDGDGSVLLQQPAVGGPALVVLTEREMNAAEQTALERRAGLVLKKGSLSRTAFARKVATLCEASVRRRRRVLAVDDNEQNLRLIAAVLARGGYEILEARDASSALRIARAEIPDVILMDVMLPDLDGLSATRELKGDPATELIPVIAVTAQAMAGDDARARDAGCCDYVPKPIDSQRLLRALELATGQTP